MKILFCVFLLSHFSQCVLCDEFKNSGEVNNGGYVNDENLKSKEQTQDFIIRPCSFQDLNCIRGFFAHNLQCLIAEGPRSDPYVIQLIPNIHIPHANLTFEMVNAQIKGLDKWKIEEFYINKATDTLVLEVVLDKIVVTSPESRLKYNRKGKEPLQVADYSVIEYDNLSFTLTVTNIKDLKFSRTNVYTYVNDAFPKYVLGPATYSSKDPGFILAITELESKLGLSLQEAFVTQGPVFFSAFFKSNICSFIY